jgi:hypothetical protein
MMTLPILVAVFMLGCLAAAVWALEREYEGVPLGEGE